MPVLPKLNDILYSGTLAYGEYVRQFEQKLKEYFDSPYVIVTNSFSAAVSVTLATMNIESEDEVIISPMACLASTQPYFSSGLKLKWADVDPKRGTLDPESVIAQITPKTKAIVHNHFCGYPGYIDEINEIGKKYGIPVIDDGIECFGSEYKGRLIGNCDSNVTIFSCGPVRIPNCIDGGIIVFKDKALYEKSLLIRDCGIDRTRFRDELGEISVDCDINLVGYSAMMSNINGYIGLMQMENVDYLLDAHRHQAHKWEDYFLERIAYTPIHCAECKPNYWVYGILANDKRKAIKDFRSMGYYASGVHIKNNIYTVFGNSDAKLPGVDEFYAKYVALPCGWWIQEEDNEKKDFAFRNM